MNELQRFAVGDVIRMPNYPTCGGFRCWKVVGEHLGGEAQEGTYELVPLDVWDNKPVQVPCVMLETHPGLVRM